MPDFSKASPTPRMPAVPSRESSLEPRPVGTVPECVPPWRHTLSTRTVRPTGTCRAPATVAAWSLSVRSEDGTTTALLRRPGKEGPAPVPRGTGGLPPSPGLSSDGWTAAPSRLAGESLRGAHEPSLSHTPLAPVLHQVKVKRSYQPGGQGRRAGGRGQGRLFLAGDPLPTHLSNGLHPIQAPNMVGLRVSQGTH